MSEVDAHAIARRAHQRVLPWQVATAIATTIEAMISGNVFLGVASLLWWGGAWLTGRRLRRWALPRARVVKTP